MNLISNKQYSHNEKGSTNKTVYKSGEISMDKAFQDYDNDIVVPVNSIPINFPAYHR